MGERIHAKFRALYAKAQETVDDWSSTQVLTLALISSASNVITRLPSFLKDENFDIFGETPEVKEAIRAKQMQALENTLQRLLEQLPRFQNACGTLEKIAQDGRHLYQAACPLHAHGSERRGATACLVECQEGLEDIWRMHRDDFELKAALINSIRWDMTEEELGQIQTLVRAQPTVDPTKLRTLLKGGQLVD
mmetsp:Transcript_26130/g.56667  ORF Transcript_26130/g.56667 Transcript_26130/m.56667 type:complete len:193 (+) Transcript_26130:92-670(+)